MKQRLRRVFTVKPLFVILPCNANVRPVHFTHSVICELLRLSIVNKFSNLKMYSSMVKKVYLTFLHFSSGELASPYQVLDVDIQLSRGLLFVLLDVTKVLLSGLPI